MQDPFVRFSAYQNSVARTCDVLKTQGAPDIEALLLHPSGSTSKGAESTPAAWAEATGLGWECLTFVHGVAVAAVLRSLNLTCDCALGYGIGEITAAVVAGALPLEDATHILLARGKVLAAASSDDLRILTVPAEVALSNELPEGVCVYAVLSPKAAILLGRREGLTLFAKTHNLPGARPVAVGAVKALATFGAIASLGEEAEEEMANMCAYVSPATHLQCPLASTRSGQAQDPSNLTSRHWWRSMTATARVSEAAEHLAAAGNGNIAGMIECGPAALSIKHLRGLPALAGAKAHAHGLVQKGDNAVGDSLFRTLADFYTAGINIKWRSLYGARPRFLQAMPRYPLTRVACWADFSSAAAEQS